ncbi:Rnf-Nqr domain containing protein [Arenimonas oryziterrae]|uniref:Electron transport complex subunit RsxE n=1 Tax=Arenimonas oryziterrae DSM 21050 = YC6267 TaxID=1121015 RepID=A0A091AM92_9GAMM|nr:Rnf-Nqr domain containing protein [Arenimonas oryziterrae]KFN41323.1 hypothetical protein N789_05450 [Arenimonas oryziterrae DSM 21050 = YC6267]
MTTLPTTSSPKNDALALRSMRWLALLPLLATSQDAVLALGMGIVAMIALSLTSVASTLLPPTAGQHGRLMALVMSVATVVTLIDLSLRAWWPDWHAALGLFAPLLASSCLLQGTLASFAPPRSPWLGLRAGLTTGASCLALLLSTGILRELIGTGQLFARAGTLLHLSGLEMTLLPGYAGFLVAILPAGALLTAAAVIALWQTWSRRHPPSESA